MNIPFVGQDTPHRKAFPWGKVDFSDGTDEKDG